MLARPVRLYTGPLSVLSVPRAPPGVVVPAPVVPEKLVVVRAPSRRKPTEVPHGKRWSSPEPTDQTSLLLNV